MKLGIDKI